MYGDQHPADALQGMGMILESLRQPVINGYLIAGSIVGPGGLQLIKVQCLPNLPTCGLRWSIQGMVCMLQFIPRPNRPNLLMQELVQVESLAQVGVQLLLFTLGLEFRWVRRLLTLRATHDLCHHEI